MSTTDYSAGLRNSDESAGVSPIHYSKQSSADSDMPKKGGKSFLSSPDTSTVKIECDPLEMKPIVTNPLFKHKNLREIPVPRGNTPYCKAKRAEYVERNLPEAEKYYKEAIQQGERLESSIKDLATVLHQQGKTEEAIDFLEENRDRYPGDQTKYDNLLANLRKQIVPSGNVMSRTLVLFDAPDGANEDWVRDLFSKSSRILNIEVKPGNQIKQAPGGMKMSKTIWLVHFASYSAARKTLNTMFDPDGYTLYWMNINGEIVEKAEVSQRTREAMMNKKKPKKSNNNSTHSSLNNSTANNSYIGNQSGNAGHVKKTNLSSNNQPQTSFQSNQIFQDSQSFMKDEFLAMKKKSMPGENSFTQLNVSSQQLNVSRFQNRSLGNEETKESILNTQSRAFYSSPLQQKLFQKSLSSTVDPYSVFHEVITESSYNNVDRNLSANLSMNVSAPFSLEMSSSKELTFPEYSESADSQSSEISFDDLAAFFPKLGK